MYAQNWQQQMEELIALQAILMEDFRVLSLPEKLLHHHHHSTEQQQEQEQEQQDADPAELLSDPLADLDLEALLGSEPPTSPDPLMCEALVHVEVSPCPLQLLISTPAQQPSSATGGGAKPLESKLGGGISTAGAGPGASSKKGRQQQQQQQQQESPSSCSGTCVSTAQGKCSGCSEACCCSPAGPATLSSSSSGSSVVMPIGGPVQYLPPLRVLLTFPRSYPSHDPPQVQVLGCWLSPGQQAALQQQLLTLWEEQGPGEAICYLWLEWLKSQALEHLGIIGKLLLPTPAPAPAAAAAATGDQPQQQQQQARSQQQQQQQQASSPEQIAMQVLTYNGSRRLEDFKASSWPCAICMEAVAGARCVQLPECRHVFCGECMRQYCATLVADGAVEALRCPDLSCGLRLAPFVLQQLLTKEQYARWEELLLQRTLDKMEDIVYCPRCQAVCVQDKDNLAQCPGCMFAFCSICSDSWHPGVACLNEEQRLLVMERRKGRSGPKDPRRDLDLVNQLLSLALVSKTCKNCPGCGMAVHKTEGCNKMKCAYCSSTWCWRCEQLISGYDHFKAAEGPGGSGCILFEQQEVDRWNAMWGGGAAAWAEQGRGEEVYRGQLMAGRPGARLHRCPVCGQENAKEGRNNLVRCWACNSHFCAACRTWLRQKVGAHYGPGGPGCKQHSSD